MAFPGHVPVAWPFQAMSGRPARFIVRPTAETPIRYPRAAPQESKTPVPSSTRLLLPALASAALTLPASSLLGGHKNFENENDTLRRRVLELEQQVQLAQAGKSEALAKISELEKARQAPLPPEVLEALPRVAGIEIDRLSGPIDKDGTPGPDAITVAVSTYDGRRRFVQAVGTLTIEASLLPAQIGSAPIPLGTLTLGPKDLREAYRYDLTGIYYSATLPLAQPNSPLEGTIVLRAEFDDAVTGEVFRAERLVGGATASK
jgi:hypothetical protein